MWKRKTATGEPVTEFTYEMVCCICPKCKRKHDHPLSKRREKKTDRNGKEVTPRVECNPCLFGHIAKEQFARYMTTYERMIAKCDPSQSK